MDYNRTSRPNVVTLFFGMATALTLITVLIASLFFNRLPQPQASELALSAQSQQPGYSYTEAAATETVHNKALLLLVALGAMAAAAMAGMLIISNISNRRIMRQIAQFNQQHPAKRSMWQVQEVYIVDNPQVAHSNRKAYRNQH
ncbi:MAG: hypothetical protein GC179_08995 [Anaerolineaceae bacterium]|nr:hypothetical protein [Anaerolineaceae bacterium]